MRDTHRGITTWGIRISNLLSVGYTPSTHNYVIETIGMYSNSKMERIGADVCFSYTKIRQS